MGVEGFQWGCFPFETAATIRLRLHRCEDNAEHLLIPARRGAVADATLRAEPGEITMALSDKDHIDALRQRLVNKRIEKEAEIREIQEMLHVLDVAPKLLEGKFNPLKSEPEPERATRTLANRNITKLVREWLDEYSKYDEAIEINSVRDDLKRQGVKGKDRSLYSAIHVIIKKEAEKREDMYYKKGVGFFKSRKDPSRLTHEDTELVHAG